ncbi:hypothetical protein A3Q56_03351 [Intoshia linei]|uniref:Protein kinase domain-containing protein n=1 Tax=Intoshia linei TaxID=1819745 RepID=A0A177B3P8_9BILA|nr:hypothetical protein A3Q56_03351 [Intoshia linei]
MEQIYNANESAVFYKKSPKFTLAHASEKSIPGYKSSKDRLLKIIIISWEEQSMEVDDSQILYTDDAEPSISEEEMQDMLSSAIVTLFFVDEEGKNKWKDHFDKITQKFTLFMKALQQPTTTGKQTSGSNKSYSSQESEKGDECSKDNESDTLPSISSEDYETEKYIINNDARLLLNYTNESLTKNDFTWKMSNLIDGVYKDLIIDERIYYKLYNNKCVLNRNRTEIFYGVNNCEISDEGFYLCTYGNEKCYFEIKIMENPFFQTMYEGISIKYLDFEDYYTESENSEPKFYTSVLSKYTDEDAENYISYKLLNDENCRALAVDELRILSSLRNKNILNILVNHMYITTEHIYIPFNPCIKTAVIQDIMNLNYLKEDIMSCIIYQLYEAFIYLHSNKILYNNDLLFNVFVHEYEFLSKDITISIANFTKSKYISTETPKFDRIVNGNFKNLATQDFERISNFAFNIYNGTNENDSSGHNYISDIDCNFSFVCYYDYIKSNIKNEYDYLCHYYFTQKSQKHIDTQHIKDYVKNIDL